MNQNQQLIEEFYAAFAIQNIKTMASCYHRDIEFQDPVFGILRGQEVIDMWQMLIERSKGNIKIEFSDIKSIENSGTAKWIATYDFSMTNRKVVNTIFAKFEFKDGLIVRHTDYFDFWKWSQQAFGLKGTLLGWTGFMQNKIRNQAQLALNKFRSKINISS